MAESTNFSTSQKGLSKAAYFTIFRTAVTEGTFRVLPKIVFTIVIIVLNPKNHQLFQISKLNIKQCSFCPDFPADNVMDIF